MFHADVSDDQVGFSFVGQTDGLLAGGCRQDFVTSVFQALLEKLSKVVVVFEQEDTGLGHVPPVRGIRGWFLER